MAGFTTAPLVGKVMFFREDTNQRKRSEYTHFKRGGDFEFTPAEQISDCFENKHKTKIGSIATGTGKENN